MSTFFSTTKDFLTGLAKSLGSPSSDSAETGAIMGSTYVHHSDVPTATAMAIAIASRKRPRSGSGSGYDDDEVETEILAREIGYPNKPKQQQQRKVYMCTRCRVPLKGHKCPKKTTTTTAKRDGADDIEQRSTSLKQSPVNTQQQQEQQLQPKRQQQQQEQPKRKAYMCSYCNVPRKGHTCPLALQYVVTLPPPKQSRKTDKQRDDGDDHDDSGKPAAKKKKIQLCSKCRVPCKGHTCPYRQQLQQEQEQQQPLAQQQEDGVVNDNNNTYTLSTSSLLPAVAASKKNKKSYLCSKCRVPLKGHKCPYKQENHYSSNNIPKNSRKPKDKDDHPSKKRARDKDESSSSSFQATKDNDDDDFNFDSGDDDDDYDMMIPQPPERFDGDSDDFSDDNTETKLAQARQDRGKLTDSDYDDVDDDDDDESFQDLANKLNTSRGSKKSNNDNSKTSKAPPPATNNSTGRPRHYMCRMCGVPRRGHVCPYSKFTSNTNNNGSSPRKRRKNNDNDDSNDDDDDSDKLTEVMAAAHMFQDEVREYTEQHKEQLSVGERQFLLQWNEQVQTSLLDQNALVRENIRLTAERRDADKQVRRARDEQTILQSKIRRIQMEHRQLEARLHKQQRDRSAQRNASRFLESLDRICSSS